MVLDGAVVRHGAVGGLVVKSRTLVAYIFAVNAAALGTLLASPAGVLEGHLGTLLILIGLAALAGAKPVRLPRLRHEITATHPFIFLALAALGTMAAVLVALAGVVGAALGRRPRLALTMRSVLNLGAVCLSTTAASGVFLAVGGRPGQDLLSVMAPLAAATAAYFVANTSLVAVAIALEKRQGFFSIWRRSFLMLALFNDIAPWAYLLAGPGVAPQAALNAALTR